VLEVLEVRRRQQQHWPYYFWCCGLLGSQSDEQWLHEPFLDDEW
jgi:hypothetical protein